MVAVPGALTISSVQPRAQTHSISFPIASIGPDQPHAGKPPYQFIDDQLRSISIMDIGRMHHHRQQQPHGIYNDVSLSTVDLLASVIATRPPFSVADWLSMMAALGVGLLPSALLWAAGPHGLVPMYHPVSIPENSTTRCPKAGGHAAWLPCAALRRTYTMPLTTSRRSTVRGLPPVLADGSREARTSHCSSVRSLGYGLRFIPPF